MVKSIKYLSFEGGGVKGIAYIGVLQFLEEHDMLNNLVSVSGSSIGSIIALCVAMKLSCSDVKKLFYKYNLYDFFSIMNIVKFIPNLYYNYGCIGTEELDKIISEIFTISNVCVDITFGEFFTKYGVNLVVPISNITRQSPLFCNYETCPDLSVKQVCIISASFPVIFNPTLLDGEYYADGGIFANMPFNYLMTNITDDCAYGIMLQNNSVKITNFVSYIDSIINGLVSNATNEYYMVDGKIDPRIIEIKIPDDISTFSVLTDIQKQLLISNGYESMKIFFN